MTYPQKTPVNDPFVSTFSIVGYDPYIPAWGIAIASRFLAVGAKTCWGAGDAGVVVVQAYLNAKNGLEGLDLLRSGLSSEEVINQLMKKDINSELRQIAVIDLKGIAATYTGSGCEAWAGGVVGHHCAAQGNMLLAGEGCNAMVEHFASSKGNLDRRLVEALAIGDRVAGDARGRQSAALLVVQPPTEQSFDVFTEPTIDLRVDDHPNPFKELERLLDLHDLIFLPTDIHERLEITSATVKRLQHVMIHLGYYQAKPNGLMDPSTQAALVKLTRHHNLSKRLGDPRWLDSRALSFLEKLIANTTSS